MRKIITRTLFVALFMSGLQLMAQPALAPAPVPDRDTTEVKSIFSDAYTNLVTGFTFTGEGTISMVTPFPGDNMIHILQGLNFWSNVHFSNPVDIDDKEYLHIDIFLDRATATDLRIRFDGASALTFNFSPGWNSLDIPLDDFRNLATTTDFTQISALQMIRPGGYPATIYIDNIYAYGGDSEDPTDPTEPEIDSAPAPVHATDDVISIFSDSYTSVSTIESFSGEGDGEVLQLTADDEVIKITNGLNMWSGINFTPVNIENATAIRLDLYLARDAGTDVRVRFNGGSAITAFYEPGWNVIEFTLDELKALDNPPDLTDIKLVEFIRTNGFPATIYVDNIYAHGIKDTDPTDPTEPEIASAPAPVHTADDVISIFSDAYTSVSTIESFSGEGDGEVLQLTADDEVIKITNGLNMWSGINFTPVDIENTTAIRLDLYLARDAGTDVRVRFNGGSAITAFYEPGWNVIEFTLDDLKALDIPPDLTDIKLIEFIRTNGFPATIYVDNIYAHGIVDTDPTDPTDPEIDSAPAPVHATDDVISIFSDAYTSVSTIESFSGEGTGEVLQLTADDEVIKITNGLNMWSVVHFTSVNIDHMSAIRFDLYLDREAGTDIRVRFNGGSAITKFYQPGWNIIEIPLDDFRALASAPNFTDLKQIEFIRTNGYPATIYVDNIYAHGIEGDPVDPDPTDPDAPTVSAPIPQHPAEDVISLFSDAYINITTISVNNAGSPPLTLEYVTPLPGDNMMKIESLNWGMFRLDNYPHEFTDDMDYLHLDIYLPSTSASLRVGIGNWTQVSSSAYSLTHGWNSLDIPMDIYRDGGVDMTDLIILRLTSSTGFAISKLFVDNIYAYSGEPQGDHVPTFEIEAAPEPIMAPATVKSLFTDKYTNIAQLNEVEAVGTTDFKLVYLTQEDRALRMRSLEEMTVGASAPVNINDMEALHFNIYYDAEGGDGALEIGLQTLNHEVTIYSVIEPELVDGQWTYVNISLDEFSNAGIDLSAIDNIVFRGSGNIYISNIFAYKGAYALGKGEEGRIVVDWAEASKDDELPDRDLAFLGVNLATGSGGTTPGVYNQNYSYPTFQDLYYFKSKGVRLIRLPFKWERIQHEVGGPLNTEADLKYINEVIAEAQRIGMYVMPDMHNYCRRYVNGVRYRFGESPNLTDEHFADVWTKLADVWKDFDNIWGYDLMNEPYGLTAGVWASAAQAAIDGIRTVDTETPIVIEGEDYASASTWINNGAPLYEQLVDPNDNLIWQAHTYFDANKSGQYSGTYDEEVSSSNIHIARLRPFVEWLVENDLRGVLGEFGVPRDDVRWLNMLEEVLVYLKEHQVSATYWTAGSWYESNSLSVQPLKNYTLERTPMRVLGNYFHDFHVVDEDEDPTTSIGDVVKSAPSKIYPNPFSDRIIVESEVGIKSVQILNASGLLVKTVNGSGYNRLEINFNDPVKGIFFIRVFFEDGSIAIEKLIKM